MSAKELTIFVHKSIQDFTILHEAITGLSLEIDRAPAELNLSYQFSAHKGSGKTRLSVEWKNDDSELIREMLEWAHPSAAYKSMLADCKSSITIYYRDRDLAKEAILELGTALEKARAPKCVVENGQGCLLKLDDFLTCLRQAPQWSWERPEFPDLVGVAPSEWQ